MRRRPIVRSRIAGGLAALVIVGSLGLAGCLAPPPPPSSVNCSDAGDVPPGPTATGSNAIATCHQQIKPYTVSIGLTVTAQSEAAERAGFVCQNGALVHSPPPGVSENLYCWWNGTSTCPTAGAAATKAVNGWLASAGHKANINGHSSVGAAVICNSGHYFAVAHYQ
jgi:hypothetical protein